jgi:hypothetical protein
MRIIFTISLFTILSSLYTQDLKLEQYPFFAAGNKPLPLALVGGFNSPHFSEADFNKDGKMDLFVFDRIGNVPMVFLNEGVSNTVSYTYSKKHSDGVPQTLSNWALMRDYNKDGAGDIFAFSAFTGSSGIEVWDGFYVGNDLRFRRKQFYGFIDNIISYPTQGTGARTNLNVSVDDLPEIIDLDSDGDLDIATFINGGASVVWFQNTSSEKGHGADSLDFFLSDPCWGKFYEDAFNATLYLSCDPNKCANDCFTNPIVEERHAGSTVTLFDLDSDGDMEAFIGDLSNPHLYMVKNGGTKNNAFMNSRDSLFPSYDTPVFMNLFLASAFLDVDNDGRKDLISSINNIGVGDNIKCASLHKNVGQGGNHRFEYEDPAFLVGKMVDLGTGSNPHYFDYNADGLMDLLIGSSTDFVGFGRDARARLVLYENKGTRSDPVYLEVDRDYLGLNGQIDFTDFVPASGDIDSDGDVDLLIGTNRGEIIFFRNSAGPGKKATWDAPVYKYSGIDIGQNAAPFLADVEGRGVLDLFVGERTGDINYFRNRGTATNPLFDASETLAGNSRKIGGMTFKVGNDDPYVVPALKKLGSKWYLWASSLGKILWYEIPGNSVYSTFNLLDANFIPSRFGQRLGIDLMNIDSDPFLELMVGNSRGGLQIVETKLRGDASVSTSEELGGDLKVYPNPAQNTIHFDIPKGEVLNEIRIMNPLGQTNIFQMGQNLRDLYSLDISSLTTGLYFGTATNDQGKRYHLKFIKE